MRATGLVTRNARFNGVTANQRKLLDVRERRDSIEGVRLTMTRCAIASECPFVGVHVAGRAIFLQTQVPTFAGFEL